MTLIEVLRNKHPNARAEYTHGTDQSNDETPAFIDLIFRTRAAAEEAQNNWNGEGGFAPEYHEEPRGHVLTFTNLDHIRTFADIE